MKALKEKRVSLRSLFRRSLVILSLLALAFAVASCGDSGGTEVPDTSTPQTSTPDTSNPPAGLDSLEWVSGMQVLKHPNKPSYEGAAPDLSGLEVMVTWSKGGEVTKRELHKSADFIAYPPVAFVRDPGTHVTEFSRRGDYRIQYVAEGYYDLGAYTENVFIPGVIALDPAHFDTNDPLFPDANLIAPTTTGSIPLVKEDEAFDASGVSFEAVYVAFGATDHDGTTPATGSTLPNYSNGIPPESYYTSLGDIDWPTVSGTAKERVKSNPVSSNTEAWRITKREEISNTVPTALYLASLGSPYVTNEADLNQPVGATKFYYVDRFEYLDGYKNIKGGKILADDAALSGLATSNTLAAELTVRTNWWQEMQKVGDKITFKVTYYDPATGQKGLAPKTITFNDYVKAMFRTRGDFEAAESTLRPRATLPQVVGRGTVDTTAGVSSGVQDSLMFGYEDAVYLNLFYYDPKIKGTAGNGYIDNADLQSGYETPNLAQIPISDLIWQYDHVEAVRIDSTDHPEEWAPGGPELVSGWGGTETNVSNGLALYERFQSYYKIVWYYVDPNDPNAAPEPVDYVPTAFGTVITPTSGTSFTGRGASTLTSIGSPTWPATDGQNGGTRPTVAVNSQIFLEQQTNLAVKEGDLVYDNAVADEREVRTATVQVLEPLSAATVTWTTVGGQIQPGSVQIRRARDEVELEYVMLPN